MLYIITMTHFIQHLFLMACEKKMQGKPLRLYKKQAATWSILP